MNRVIFALSILSIVGLAAWAYQVNYRTNTVLREIDRLNAEIAERREALQVLRVEWAYLNNPERLRRLVARNNADLALMPIAPDRFGHVAAVPFPPIEEGDAVMAALAAAAASGAFVPPRAMEHVAAAELPAPGPTLVEASYAGTPLAPPMASSAAPPAAIAPELVTAAPGGMPLPPRRPGALP